MRRSKEGGGSNVYLVHIRISSYCKGRHVRQQSQRTSLDALTRIDGTRGSVPWGKDNLTRPDRCAGPTKCTTMHIICQHVRKMNANPNDEATNDAKREKEEVQEGTWTEIHGYFERREIASSAQGVRQGRMVRCVMSEKTLCPFQSRRLAIPKITYHGHCHTKERLSSHCM